LGTNYLVVLCAGFTLLLAKQSLDEAPYKLSEAIAKLAGITFSRIKPPTGLITLVSKMRENLLLYSSNLLLGFSNWPVIYYIFPRQLGTEVFCRRCRVLKKKLSHHHHRAISTSSAANFLFLRLARPASIPMAGGDL
jgi:hypothetical protein